MLGGVPDDVGDDPHRRLRRIDIRVPHHELFENVVLHGAGKLGRVDPLLLGRHDVHRNNRQHSAVHGHRDGHPVERNTVEENFHILDAVDRDTRFAYVPDHSGMVGVVAAVRGEVERDRQARLARGKIAAVEGVRFLRRGVPRVLA